MYFDISSYEVREHMCLYMIDGHVGDSEFMGQGPCHTYTHQERRHESGELRAGDNIQILQRHIRFGEDFFQDTENIVGMEPGGNLRNHSLRLVVFPDLRPCFHGYKLPIPEYGNRGVVTGSLKGEEEHITFG